MFSLVRTNNEENDTEKKKDRPSSSVPENFNQ
jgi:hypothetical protein